MPDPLPNRIAPPGTPGLRELLHEINNANNLGLLGASLLGKLWEDLRPLLDEAARLRPDLKAGNLPLPQLLEEIPALLRDQESAAGRIKDAVRSLRDLDLVPRGAP